MSVTKMYVTDEDREALEWVRSHGGLDHVKAEWRSRVPYDRYVRRRQSLLRHIAECETALGRRRRRIEELGHRVKVLTNENAELRRRAMPEIDTWQRIEEDAKKYPCHYFGHERNTCDGCPAHSVYGSCKHVMTSDLVRRCKALAEKENRNE